MLFKRGTELLILTIKMQHVNMEIRSFKYEF